MRAVLAAMLVLMPLLGARADQNDPRLTDLFARLAQEGDPREARAAEALVWRIWIEQDDDDVRLLMEQGILHLSRDEHMPALAAFDAVVQRAPGFAEGWNKRATVLFLMGDFDASVADIERTLALEKRHFGALSGLGQIYLALGRKAAALKAFEAALAIDANLASVRAVVEALRKELAGKPT